MGCSRQVARNVVGAAHAGRTVGAEAGAEFGEAGDITAKDGLFGHAVLKAGKVGDELGRALVWQPIDDKVGATLGFHETVAPEVAEVLGNFHLRFTEHGLKMTNAEGSLQQKVQNAQACPVTEAFVDADEIHRMTIPI